MVGRRCCTRIDGSLKLWMMVLVLGSLYALVGVLNIRIIEENEGGKASKYIMRIHPMRIVLFKTNFISK